MKYNHTLNKTIFIIGTVFFLQNAFAIESLDSVLRITRALKGEGVVSIDYATTVSDFCEEALVIERTTDLSKNDWSALAASEINQRTAITIGGIVSTGSVVVVQSASSEFYRLKYYDVISSAVYATTDLSTEIAELKSDVKAIRQSVGNVYDETLGYSAEFSRYITGGWYLLNNCPIAHVGTITELHLPYDPMEGYTPQLKIGVFSYNATTGEATLKSKLDLTDVANNRDFTVSVNVEKGDILGLYNYARLATCKSYATCCLIGGGGDSTIVGESYLTTTLGADIYATFNLQYAAASESETNYANLNIVLLGDSLLANAGFECDNKAGSRWPYWFKRHAKPKTIYNYAVGGAHWCHGVQTSYDLSDDYNVLGNANNNIYNQLNRLIYNVETNDYPKPDLIIIACGTNDTIGGTDSDEQIQAVFSDYENITWFAPTNSYWCNISEYPNQNVAKFTSIAKALRFDMELILQKFPNSQVIFLTPLQRVAASVRDEAQGGGFRWKNSGDCIERCAYYYGAPVIRMDREIGICKMREAHEHKMLQDGVHTTAYGAKVIGTFLSNRISQYISTSDDL